MATIRIPVRALFVLGLGLAAGGCSRSFWYRDPQVAGSRQAPQATLPPPQVRTLPPAGTGGYAAPTPYAPAPYAQAPYAAPPTTGSYPAPGAPAEGTRVCASAEEQAVFAAVNAIRTSRGLRPFDFHPALYVAARDHSREQLAHGYMGHGSPDPARNGLPQRMALAGYQGALYGEVVAWGYPDARSVVEGWMNSREHRDILVDPELREAAYARVGPYWTGNFGAPVPRSGAWSAPPATRPAPTFVPPPTRTWTTPAPSAVPPPAVRAPSAPPSPPPRPATVVPARPAPAPAPAPARPPARGG